MSTKQELLPETKQATDNTGPRDISLALAPSHPERDARQIQPLAIPDELLGGSEKDRHKVFSEYISSNLQGRTRINSDSGMAMKFTGASIW